MYKGKRLLDILGAMTGLLFFAPLMLLIAILIRLFIKEPALFKQPRPGLNGQAFVLYKFRTMRSARFPDEPDANRLSSFGKLLRKTSLDELPELWNVLKGEMSLVGPRPLLLEYVPLYSKKQAKRMDVLPGITGLAQIKGRNTIDWETKFTFDLWYVKHASLTVDLTILWQTMWVVLHRKNINQSKDTTMEKFSGTPGTNLTLSCEQRETK